MTTITQIRAQLRSKPNLASALGDFRSFDSAATILQFGGTLATDARYKNLLCRAPFPSKLNELAAEPFRFRVDLDKSIAWVTSLFVSYADRLNEYVQVRGAIERCHLVGTPDQLAGELTLAQARLGRSIWLVDHQLCQTLASDDSTLRGTILSDVMHDLKVPSVARHIISWLAYRSAPRISVSDVDNLLADISFPDNGVGCLVHLALGRAPEIDEELATQLLYSIDNLPIIDQYVYFQLTLAALAASGAASAQLQRSVASMLKHLRLYVRDSLLDRLITAWSGAPCMPDRMDLGPALDAYSAGDYTESTRLIDATLGAVPSIEAVQIAVRSAISSGTDWSPPADVSSDSLIAIVAADLVPITLFSEEAVEARIRLEKVALVYSGCSWASSLMSALLRQRHDEKVWRPSRLQIFHGFRRSLDQPLFAFLLPDSECDAYLQSCAAEGFAPATCAALLRIIRDRGPDTVPPWRALRLEAYREARSGDFARSASILNEAIAFGSDPAIVGEASLLLVQVYLASGRLRDAVELAGRLVVRSTYFGLALPIPQLVDEIIAQHDEPMSDPGSVRGYLGVAIVLDIYSRQIGSKFDAERSDSFQDVLRRYRVSRASELPNYVGTLPLSELTYFLRFVCVADVLDQSLQLRSTKEVEDERVSILVSVSSMLLANSRPVPVVLKDEISEISTRQVVREATRRLDKSKVYVNVEGIRRGIDVALRETWNRYKLSTIQEAGDLELETLRKIVESALGSTVQLARIRNPLSATDQLFHLMITELRDQFTQNKEFGLNANLSTNIRHGYVLRELRTPLASRLLITNKDSESGAYQPNSHWLDRDLGNSDPVALDVVFTALSTGVDEKIEHINRDLLRIRSEINPEGLFNYDLHTQQFRALEIQLGPLESYEEFVSQVIDNLWAITERNLKRVRDVLTSTIQSDFMWLISQFEQSLYANGVDKQAPLLLNAVTLVRQEVRDAIARVADWFTLSRSHDYDDFALKIAFQAGLQSVRKYYAHLHISETFTASAPIVLSGWTLPIFARLFFLLLDNAASHGAGNRPALNIEVAAEVDETTLLLTVSNDLDPNADFVRLDDRIAQINKEYGQANAAERAGEEGGSGYPKVWKLLNFDLRSPHDLAVSRDGYRFVVSILMSIRGIRT